MHVSEREWVCEREREIERLREYREGIQCDFRVQGNGNSDLKYENFKVGRGLAWV